jgi:hypothetical protein
VRAWLRRRTAAAFDERAAAAARTKGDVHLVVADPTASPEPEPIADWERALLVRDGLVAAAAEGEAVDDVVWLVRYLDAELAEERQEHRATGALLTKAREQADRLGLHLTETCDQLAAAERRLATETEKARMLTVLRDQLATRVAALVAQLESRGVAHCGDCGRPMPWGMVHVCPPGGSA